MTLKGRNCGACSGKARNLTPRNLTLLNAFVKKNKEKSLAKVSHLFYIIFFREILEQKNKMKEKIKALRSLMKDYNIQAYIIPAIDPHQSEYTPKFWQRLKFISSFSGSAGNVVIIQRKAGLWTDSRYFLQAEQQLDSSLFTLFKMGLAEVPTWQDWILNKLKRGETLGVDQKLISHKEYQNLKNKLATKGIGLKGIKNNLVDLIWDKRPVPSKGKIEVHGKKCSGETTIHKLKRLRAKMAEKNADVHVITQLDAIAWLFNIRGSDVPFNPVVISYAIITPKKAMLFTDLDKVSGKAKQFLKGIVEFRNYDNFENELQKLARSGSSVWLDKTTVSLWIVDVLKDGKNLFYEDCPIPLFKAKKNKTEIAGFRASHIRDGVAMVKFLYWLDKHLGKIDITELSAAKKLSSFRTQRDLFKGLSFETISAYKEHSAVVHYTVTPEINKKLKPEGIYLVDSGGHYLDGTTDITRTIALGKSTKEQRVCFTRVLKGLIDLSRTSFPQGTVGKQLDTIAREPLWEIGLNYGHGTGHGVGSFLNVHEGPHHISYYRCTGVALEPGMVTSIEPGYYKENEYGIRIENMALVIKDEDKSRKELVFYKFETLTLCPIDLHLVKKDIMTETEIKWLNNYHKKVHKTLAPHLDKEETNWLKEATEKI